MMLNKLLTVKDILLSKYLGIYKPIFVAFALTNKCNNKCVYCQICELKKKELTTSEILNILKQLKKAGTKRISLVGGEPLIRKDIGLIVDKIKKYGMHLTITTNGKLVKEKISVVKRCDIVKISYDGPKKIHDKQRGKGSYDKFIEALGMLKRTNSLIVLNSTITKDNHKFIPQMLSFSAKNKMYIKFQPVSTVHHYGEEVKKLYPSIDEKRSIIKELIRLKKKSNRIINSLPSIKSFYSIPVFKDCVAGKILCRIAADGNIYPCTMKEYRDKEISCKNNVMRAFSGLSVGVCDYCMCSSTLELNNLYNYDFDTIMNLIKTGF